MQQISIELENRPGQLARMLGFLAESQVEIRALTVGHTARDTEKGLVKMIVNQVDRAVAILREKSIEAKVEEVLVTPVEDHAGGLHAILKILAEADLNIEHMYTFVSRVEGKALSVFTCNDAPRARQVLRSAGVRLVSAHQTADRSPDSQEELEITEYWGHDVTW
ncbi:MAG: hypothetical protein JW797_10080 [Bradymonadales bacterium]|nr:hypothetical protein [Bradymonadales bacterium]